MQIEARLKEMGVELSVPKPRPDVTFVSAVRVGDLIYTSGHTSQDVNTGEAYIGKLGAEVSLENGYKAAQLCAIRCLGCVKSVIGDLDKIKRIVKVLGFVNHAEGFTQQPQVMNGASDLLVELFGEAGRHSRAAIGVYGLPGGAAVEVEMVVLVGD